MFAGDRLLGQVEVGRQSGGAMAEIPARRGERQVSGGAMHQLHTVMVFQLPQSSTDRRLGDSQPIGRRADRAGICHADEGDQGRESVHIVLVSATVFFEIIDLKTPAQRP